MVFDFFRKKEKRYTEAEIASILSGQVFHSRIAKDEAMNIPAVGTAVNFIAGTIAGLPIRLYRKDGDNVTEVLDDYRLKLLNDDTNDLLDAEQFKKAIISDMPTSIREATRLLVSIMSRDNTLTLFWERIV